MIKKNVDLTEKRYIKAKFEMEVDNSKTVMIDGAEYFSFKGYGSTFGNVDRDNERMAKGCFEESLKEAMPALLWQHQMKEPIGIFKACREDNKGLYVEGIMPLDDTLVKGRVMPQIKCGSVRAMSIGFTVQEYQEDTVLNIVTWTKVKLWEISLVTIPANAQATVTEFKSQDEMLDEATTLKDIEKYLKSFGISNKKCGIIISKVKGFVRDGQNLESDGDELPSDLENELKSAFDKLVQIKMEETL